MELPYSPSITCRLAAHTQEVCGLKWSPNGRQIATGGNDNKLCIWDVAGCCQPSKASSSGASVGSTTSPGMGYGAAEEDGESSWDLNPTAPIYLPSSQLPSCAGYSGNAFKGTTLSPLFKFADHEAAVKAVAWSPHSHGLLASGGGTADRRIRYWNTHTGECLNAVDTGSQVGSL